MRDQLGQDRDAVETYLLRFVEESAASSNGAGRRELILAACDAAKTFQQRLREWLDASEIEATLGNPTSFPVFSLRCTPSVAGLIREFPGVVSVVPDTEDVHLA